MDIYVGNLAFTATEEDLSELLAPLGAVESIKLINDRETGRFRGFAFVSMSNREQALNAIADLNGKEFLGRELRVREAAERPQSGGGVRGGQSGERRFSSGGPGGGERRFGGAPSGERRFSGGDRAPRAGGGDRGGFRNERNASSSGERDSFRGGEKGGFRNERRSGSGGGFRRDERDDDQY